MNSKMNKVFAVLQPLSEGMYLIINGDQYYMSDSVLYHVVDERGSYVHMSLNKFINMCGLLENHEVENITMNYIKWKEITKNVGTDY